MVPTVELPFSLPGFEVDAVKVGDGQMVIEAHSIQQEAICPVCQRPSRRVHSYYPRSPADVPMADCQVRLHLTVKRFRCQTATCPQKTFVERWPDLLPQNAQKTIRLRTTLYRVAYALGGQAGGQLATRLKMPVSGDTLLRLLRRTLPADTPAPKIIGVDDWAKRRGRVYGTLIVDLERHRVIDLLPDRSADTLAAWLKTHPSIELVTRDRSREYARGIVLGAPQAQQVADRWHLLTNLREAFIRLLDRLRAELPSSLTAKTPKKTGEIPHLRCRQRSQTERHARAGRQLDKRTQHAKVHQMRRAGHTIQSIARQLNVSRTTVYRYLALKQWPAHTPRPRCPSLLDPFLPDLIRQWQAGCRNASELWRQLRVKGFPGTRKSVARWVYEHREQPAPTSPSPGFQAEPALDEAANPPPLPASRRLVWLFLKHTADLEPDELTLRNQLLTHPLLAQAKQFAQDFQRLIRERQAPALEPWLKACETSQLPEFVNLAASLREDFQAVQAALTSKWSNGQTEGQVNKLKVLKRQMYGRAKLDLLRLRMLAPASFAA